MKNLTKILFLFLISTSVSFSQITPAPSPGAMVVQTVGVTKITVDYSRPSVKGRDVFGKLIAFDKVWRTGANGSTKIETTGDITVQGKVLKAGKYAIMSIPNQTNWIVIFSKDLGVNEGNYKQTDDVLRVEVRPQDVANVESFTIDFSDVKDDGASMNIAWAKMKVSLAIGVDNVASIKAAVVAKNNETSGVFQQAANYMLQKGLDLNEASSLIDKSISLRETYNNNWIKAQILSKLGKNSDALAFATKAQSLGAGDSNYQFAKDAIEKGIAEFKSKIGK